MVPYAPQRVERGKLILTCPMCGQEFSEDTDRFGEKVTANYPEHVEQEHPEKIVKLW